MNDRFDGHPKIHFIIVVCSSTTDMLAYASRRLTYLSGSRSFGVLRTMATSSISKQSTLLITPAALAEDLKKTPERVKILDATWFMPNLVPPRDPQAELLAGPRISGVTGFWDVDDVADKTHPLGLKHMMPSPERFAEACCGCRIKPCFTTTLADGVIQPILASSVTRRWWYMIHMEYSVHREPSSLSRYAFENLLN